MTSTLGHYSFPSGASLGTTSTSTAASTASTATTGTQADAVAIVNQALTAYGLQGLSNWAWNEITNGASSNQVLMDMYQTPQFAQRFPGIIARQQAGLPAISPADYVSYEDSAKQLENQYNLPAGMLSDPTRIGDLIGKDVSMSELTDRVQNGYAAVAYAPPATLQAFTQMFGANGDGALAAHFLDTTQASKLLDQQAVAAQISGQATMGSINMDTSHAMQLAQLGVSNSSVGSSLQDLQQKSALYNATINEQPNLNIGQQGVDAEFGLSAASTQQVLQREQSRQAAFQGGGSAYSDQYGAEGVGKARPL